MLQRIQTVYLFIVVLVTAALPFWLHLWIVNNGEKFYVKEDILFSICFFSSAALAFITIFLFKNRKLQFVLNRLNILLNLVLLGIFVYILIKDMNTVSGKFVTIFEKGFGMLLPILAIIFLVLANKAIKKDENLIKSVDRLR